MSSNKDINNTPWALYLTSILFGVVGVVGFVMYFTREKEIFFLILGGLFLLIALCVLPYAIVRTKAIKIYKEILHDESAFITTGTFVKSKFSSYQRSSTRVGKLDVTLNTNIYRKIVYTYVDEKGVKHTVKSKISYLKNQVEYLKNKGVFAIKCRGKDSVIIEPVPENNKSFNF